MLRYLLRPFLSLMAVALICGPAVESVASASGNGGKKRPLDYEEYVRLITGGPRKVARKESRKESRKSKVEVAAAEKPAAVQQPVVMAATPAPRRAVTPSPGRDGWRPSPEQVHEILRTSRNLAGAVLRGAVLAGFDLRGVTLAGADLFGANLAGANLDGANLRGTSLEMVNLRGASLRGANLAGAGLFKADLEGADLQGANLSGVYAVCANLRGASLAGVTTVGGHFAQATFDDRSQGAAVAQAQNATRNDIVPVVGGEKALPSGGEKGRILLLNF
ncbi:pentapeptide repeat-containing protein [Geobacter sulfurreducens]|nr:pentapeptide repeat-containing protein [Geobacter sulfurreducens]